MAQGRYDADLSELEQEFELEMEDDSAGELEYEDDTAGELDDPAGELELGDGVESFAERFYELGQGSYESEYELDDGVNELVTQMENEFFFGSLKKRLKSAGKGLLKKGLKYAAGAIPGGQVLKALTQLSRGNLKGLLGSLAKSGLAAAIPGGAVALPALKALGFEADDPDGNREAWRNYAEVSREAFEYLAENLNENADSPLEASRLATTAFQTAENGASPARCSTTSGVRPAAGCRGDSGGDPSPPRRADRHQSDLGRRADTRTQSRDLERRYTESAKAAHRSAFLCGGGGRRNRFAQLQGRGNGTSSNRSCRLRRTGSSGD